MITKKLIRTGLCEKVPANMNDSLQRAYVEEERKIRTIIMNSSLVCERVKGFQAARDSRERSDIPKKQSLFLK